MKVIHGSIHCQPQNVPTIVTIGMFDGVHLGHKGIIKQLVDSASRLNGKSVLFTFYPHPRNVLQPDLSLKMLSTQEEKLEELAKTHIDEVVIEPFTKEFSYLDASTFVCDILCKRLGMTDLVMGYDHHFGRNREGSFEQLQTLSEIYTFNLTRLEAKSMDAVTISSTKIRHALIDHGDITQANKFLGYPYQLTGKVIHGDKIGRRLDFPTANLQIDPHKLIPKTGVYLFQTQRASKTYFGLVNIGTRPTLTPHGSTRIEAFLFDFHDNLYDTDLTLHLLVRIRDERSFGSLELLKAQIEQDCQTAQAIIAQHF